MKQRAHERTIRLRAGKHKHRPIMRAPECDAGNANSAVGRLREPAGCTLSQSKMLAVCDDLAPIICLP